MAKLNPPRPLDFFGMLHFSSFGPKRSVVPGDSWQTMSGFFCEMFFTSGVMKKLGRPSSLKSHPKSFTKRVKVLLVDSCLGKTRMCPKELGQNPYRTPVNTQKLHRIGGTAGPPSRQRSAMLFIITKSAWGCRLQFASTTEQLVSTSNC